MKQILLLRCGYDQTYVRRLFCWGSCFTRTTKCVSCASIVFDRNISIKRTCACIKPNDLTMNQLKFHLFLFDFFSILSWIIRWLYVCHIAGTKKLVYTITMAWLDAWLISIIIHFWGISKYNASNCDWVDILNLKSCIWDSFMFRLRQGRGGVGYPCHISRPYNKKTRPLFVKVMLMLL